MAECLSVNTVGCLAPHKSARCGRRPSSEPLRIGAGRRPFPSARHLATIRELVQDQRKSWLRAFRLKLTIALSLVIVVAFLFYALRGEGFPDSFWVACGSVGAALYFLVVWWDLGRRRP